MKQNRKNKKGKLFLEGGVIDPLVMPLATYNWQLPGKSGTAATYNWQLSHKTENWHLQLAIWQ